MGLFSRRKHDPDETEQVESQPQAPTPPPGEPGVDRDYDRAVDGPFDVSERSEPQGRMDFGALRVPPVQGMEIRLEVEPQTTRVVGVTCGFGKSRMQLQAFAAPKSAGIWDEIRTELADGVTANGGSTQEVEGVLGTELLARMATKSASGGVAYQAVRFVGVDGPRWFLRAVIHGPAAADQKQLRAMLTLLRSVVVDRGEEPRPPREVLTLTPPKDVMDALAKQVAARRAEAAQQATAEAVRQAGPGGAAVQRAMREGGNFVELDGSGPQVRP